MEISVTVCDVCKSVDRETVRYTVTWPGGTVERDLCSEDARPLLDLIGDQGAPVERPVRIAPQKRAQSPQRASSPQRTPRARRAKVVSLEEIERSKAKA